MALTVDGLRGFIETSLGDTELGLLLDAAYEAIDAYAGADTTISEVISTTGDLFMLSRPASAISSIDENDTDLEADDYELIGDQMVRRLDTGTNPRPRWYHRIYVTYTALGEDVERDRVAIALVKLDVDNSPGVQSERLGEHSITYKAGGSYEQERAAILASYSAGFVAV